MSRKSRIAIRHGRVIDPASGRDEKADVFIHGSRVVSIGGAPSGFTADVEIDAKDRIVCPGLIDLCARLREPGLEHKATIASESVAAAAGGITTLCCPPDTDPVIDTEAVAELIEHRARQSGKVRILPIGALTHGLKGEQLSEMAGLKSAGCVAVSNAHVPIPNTMISRRTMEYAATHELIVILNSEDAWLRDSGFIHEGRVSCQSGIPGIPEAAETVAVARDLALIEQTGVRAHFGRLSTGRAVRMIARARFDGLPITADVAAHQLHLTEDAVEGFDPNALVQPPLRTADDRDKLIDGIVEGTIGAVCSDHQPHEDDAKAAPFPACEPGISALDSLLPLTLELAHRGILEMPQTLALLTSGPADILGQDYGRLAEDSVADICIFDPDAKWTLRERGFLSRGHNSPFVDTSLRGRVTHTLLAGKLVYSER